jgi:hypothetical protein
MTATATTQATTTDPRAAHDAEAYLAFVNNGQSYSKAAKATGIARTSLRDCVSRHEARMEAQQVEQLRAAQAVAAEVAAAQAERTTTTDDAPAATKKTRKPRGTTKTPVEPTPCECGCGTLVTRTFVRGHDSRLLKELRAKYAAGEMDRADVLSQAASISVLFLGKVTKSVDRLDTGSVAPVAARDCACGCGGKTARSFVRGHDSKLGKQLRAAYVAGTMTSDEVMDRAGQISERFTGKMTRALAAADVQAAAKATAEVEPAAA